MNNIPTMEARLERSPHNIFKGGQPLLVLRRIPGAGGGPAARGPAAADRTHSGFAASCLVTMHPCRPFVAARRPAEFPAPRAYGVHKPESPFLPGCIARAWACCARSLSPYVD
ncbi:unnamed protein product [Boreogadus saida]